MPRVSSPDKFHMKTKSKKIISDPAALHVPGRWYWHYRQLQALREVLLREGIAQFSEIKLPIEPHSMDPADSASDEFDHNLALGMLMHEHDALYEIDAAIERIMNGRYGVCEDTGRAIPAQRLRAVPWTRYTREAKERRERLGGKERRVGIDVPGSVRGDASAAIGAAPDPEEEDLITRELDHRMFDEAMMRFEGGEEWSEQGGIRIAREEKS
jgi:RNA polymerase-binding transcription factor DksA